MNFELSAEQKEIQEWARRLAQELIQPHAEKHKSEKISRELLKELSQQGAMALLIPEKWGGGALDSVSFSLVVEEFSKVCASTSITVAVTNMIANVLSREASEDQQERYLTQLVDGRSLTASFCLTENASGSDASALQTRATKVEGGYQISGEKIYVTNGAYSEFFLVMARTSEEPGSKGVSAFLLPRSAPGLSLGKEEDKMGLTGSSTIQMSFEKVFVPESDRLLAEGEGFKIAMRALDGGRISVASQALGTAKAALAAGIGYAKEREQFGKPIAEFQAIQWKLANAATELSAAELLIRKAAFLRDQGRSHTLEASMAKVFATEMAIRLCDEMIQIHGGYGYIKEYPVEAYYRDVRVTSLYEGTSEIQRMVIARKILSDGES